MHTYAVNRLRVGHVCQPLVLLSKVRDDDQGREVGLLIENRGSRDACWSFVGLFRSERRELENLSGSAGISDDSLLRHHGADVRHLTF